MSKAIILLVLLAVTQVHASVRPSYSTQSISSFISTAKKLKSKSDLWKSYEDLLGSLNSEKVVIEKSEQLIYMNSLMVALSEITRNEYLKANGCKNISLRLDEKFLVKGTSFKQSPQHYQDAKNILKALCK